MPNETLHLRGSKTLSRTYSIIGTAIAVLCAIPGYQVAIGRPFWQGFLIAVGFALYAFAQAIYIRSISLRLVDRYLVQTDIFRNQRVSLDQLTQAKRYMRRFGKYPEEVWRLKDSEGNTLRILPRRYSLKDLGLLAGLLNPYFSSIGEDKTFLKLPYATEQGIAVPKTSTKHTAKGTLLYLLLPCLILALVLVLWVAV